MGCEWNLRHRRSRPTSTHRINQRGMGVHDPPPHSSRAFSQGASPPRCSHAHHARNFGPAPPLSLSVRPSPPPAMSRPPPDSAATAALSPLARRAPCAAMPSGVSRARADQSESWCQRILPSESRRARGRSLLSASCPLPAALPPLFRRPPTTRLLHSTSPPPTSPTRPPVASTLFAPLATPTPPTP